MVFSSTDSQSYVLNFHGRVTQASVKNFQLVQCNEREEFGVQFENVTSKSGLKMDRCSNEKNGERELIAPSRSPLNRSPGSWSEWPFNCP